MGLSFHPDRYLTKGLEEIVISALIGVICLMQTRVLLIFLIIRFLFASLSRFTDCLSVVSLFLWQHNNPEQSTVPIV